jgi:hypothetical protein
MVIDPVSGMGCANGGGGPCSVVTLAGPGARPDGIKTFAWE